MNTESVKENTRLNTLTDKENIQLNANKSSISYLTNINRNKKNPSKKFKLEYNQEILNQNIKKNEKQKLQKIFKKIKENITNNSKIVNDYKKTNLKKSKSFFLSSKIITLLNHFKNPNKINSIENFYNKRESIRLLIKFSSLKNFSHYQIPPNFLIRHNINPKLRTKMVDWMIEVLHSFNLCNETLFVSVNIMDIFLTLTKFPLANEHIHLLGLISMFIASKFECPYYITIKDMVYKVGHEIFNENDLIKAERQIIKEISPENLFCINIYNVIKKYLFEFSYFYFSDEKIFKNFSQICFYFARLILHYENFYKYSNEVKAIGCMMFSFDVLKFHLKNKFSDKYVEVFNDWFKKILDKEGKNLDDVKIFINEMSLAYINYQEDKLLEKNLNRFYSIIDMDL